MSASLVGSEMCIRDRVQGVMETQKICEGESISLLVAKGSGETDSHRAVSYTHLTLPTICSV
eukprot:6053927-Alexandrium_andersonii.AAC.1